MKKTLFLFCCIIGFLNVRATNVSGVIISNTTWTLANSPYIVVGDVAIDSGITLTIQPGVQVRFDGSYNFYVDGRLLAIGTVTDSITFTSNKNTPATSDWRGISFRPKSGSDTSKLSFCYVEYAFRGVFSDGSILKISNSVIRRNSTGILINYNTGYLTIANNLVTRNATDGISGGTNTALSGNITGNEVSYNSTGLRASNPVTWNVTNNTFSANATGLSLTSINAAFNVSGNSVIGNSTAGISISTNNIITAPLQNNLIIYNGSGLVLNIFRGLITHNTIAYNSTGVMHTWTTTTSNNFTFEYNCITNNIVAAYRTNSTAATANVTIANNWWGTTSTSAIDTMVFDYYDNPALNKVLYTPALTLPDASCQTVSPPATCTSPTGISFAPTTLTNGVISWHSVAGAINYEYYVALSPSTPPSGATLTPNTTANLFGIQNNKLYDFCVRTRCGSSPIPSAWTCDTIRIPPPFCPAPTAIHKNFVWDDNITFSWDTIGSASSYEYYIAASPSTPPTTATTTNNSIVFASGLAQGTKYDICVRTKCGTTYSAWTCDTITTTTTGVEKKSRNLVRAYPNPVKNSFTIESPVNMNANVIITDMLGKVVHQSVFSGSKYSVDMSTASQGLYFVKCTTESGTQTIKIIKE